MSRDLINDRYGRFRELPLALANAGIAVAGLCLSYRVRPEGATIDTNGAASVHWDSLNAVRLLNMGTKSYWSLIDRIGKEFSPNIIWACSDIPHAVLGAISARRLNAKLVIDLYDNFESYPFSRIPGVNTALRRSIRVASGITCVSSPLSRMVHERYEYCGKVETIENAIPLGVFRPMDKMQSRMQFNLPTDGLLIGTAGALSPGRGTDCLIRAFQQLANERSDVHLILAGPLDSALALPDSERIHFLGLLDAELIPNLLPALDVSVIGNRNSEFGKYCFPQKLYESLACKVPVAVARVGAMADLLASFPANLYEPDDVDSLLNTLRGLCQDPRIPSVNIPTWGGLGIRLQGFLTDVLQTPESSIP